MRSYYEHLENVLHSGTDGDILTKPTFRSSALFPVMQVPGKISTRLIYFGYWILKRHIKEVTCVATLRAEPGNVLIRHVHTIHSPLSFRVELSDLMRAAGLSVEAPFIGSIELEFFSTKHLVYPFPAAAINYYGETFSTVVHTAQRVYNDAEDREANSKTLVPESGFNLYADKYKEPFISFVNGPHAVVNFLMEMEFINSENERMSETLLIEQLAPYQTHYFYPARHYALEEFFGGRVGTVKIKYLLPDVFPRLLVGNIQNQLSALSITHSYYDCSQATDASDYWANTEEGYYPATLMLPLRIDNDYFTTLTFYPILSPSALTFTVEILNAEGTLLGRKEEVVNFQQANGEYVVLSLNTVCKELNISHNDRLAMRLLVKSKDGSPIPARIKVALDIGKTSHALPCNICTNLIPYNPQLEKKPKSFRWLPLLTDRLGSSAWILDSTPKEKSTVSSTCELTFYRESDESVIVRHCTISPHGFLVIFPEEDLELKEFLNGQIGWITIQTNNPYLSLFYFSENASGSIGGDHGF